MNRPWSDRAAAAAWGRVRRFTRRRRIAWMRWRAARTREQPLHLQSQMDTHPRSLWLNRDFAADYAIVSLDDPSKRDPEDFQLDAWDNTRRDAWLLLLDSLERRGVPGDLAELGVFEGVTARFLRRFFPDRTLRLFDTFAGFSDADLNRESNRAHAAVSGRMFKGVDPDRVRRFIEKPGHRVEPIGVIRCYPGHFPDTLDEAARSARYAFVHLDADLYEPTRAGLAFFYPRVNEGGFVLVHDYNAWPGARRAVDEFANDHGLVPVPLPDKSGSALILKSIVPQAPQPTTTDAKPPPHA